MYYLRTKAATDAIKFTVEGHNNHNHVATTTNGIANTVIAGTAPEDVSTAHEVAMAEISCSIDNKDECLACGS